MSSSRCFFLTNETQQVAAERSFCSSAPDVSVVRGSHKRSEPGGHINPVNWGHSELKCERTALESFLGLKQEEGAEDTWLHGFYCILSRTSQQGLSASWSTLSSITTTISLLKKRSLHVYKHLRNLELLSPKFFKRKSWPKTKTKMMMMMSDKVQRLQSEGVRQVWIPGGWFSYFCNFCSSLTWKHQKIRHCEPQDSFAWISFFYPQLDFFPHVLCRKM